MITGAKKRGATLRATAGSWYAGSFAGGWSWQWYRGASPIKGGTKATYRPTATDVGKRLKVVVRPKSSIYKPILNTSATTSPIAK